MRVSLGCIYFVTSTGVCVLVGMCATPPQVEFLTTDRVLRKFYGKFALGEKSEYIDDDGNVIKQPGAQYNADGVRALY